MSCQNVLRLLVPLAVADGTPTLAVQSLRRVTKNLALWYIPGTPTKTMLLISPLLAPVSYLTTFTYQAQVIWVAPS
ncbi:hypothetical protein F4859DRAFT_407554 [Xylaria cf. heliscus]|nr:hypothetical protein F4859DRAFT_407554 [Xylaria cf. heliscus]